jgi:hypothetical protein
MKSLLVFLFGVRPGVHIDGKQPFISVNLIRN